MICVSISAATDYLNQTYFVDSKSDVPRNIATSIAERSIDMQIYTLDMLFQNKLNKETSTGNSLDEILQNDSRSMNKDRKKKLQLLIKGTKKKAPNIASQIFEESFGDFGMLFGDINKQVTKQVIGSDITRSFFLNKLDESASREYFVNLQRVEIYNYLKRLDSSNEKSIPVFINESAIYYNNPEFYCSYADFLLEKKNKNIDQIINYLLLGEDYKSAEKLLEASKGFSNAQKIKILELAQKPKEAYNLCLKTDAKNYERLYQLALASGLKEEAYQHYLSLNPNDTQTLTKLSYQTGNYNRALEHARVKPLEDEYMLDLFIKTDSNYDALLTAIKIDDPRASQFADKLSDAEKNKAFDYFVERSEFIRACRVRSLTKLPETRLSEIREGIDGEFQRLLTDPNINHQIVMEKEFGKNVKEWTIQKALLAQKIRPDVELDMGDYYQLAVDYEAAYRYYLASHQYIKAINLHQQHLNYSAEQIGNEQYKRAGVEAEANEDLNSAISFYLKAGAGNDQKLSDLFCSIGDFDQSIYYQLKADSCSYQRLAELYEFKNDYEKAANYYIKANLGKKAIANAQKIQPTNYLLLIEANQLYGNVTEVQRLLDEYYNLDYLKAGTEYIKYGKSSQYLNKISADNKLDALDQYNLYSEISVQKLDELINTYPESELNSVQKKIIDERLKLYEKMIDGLSLNELDSAIALAKRADDRSKEVKFSNIKLARLIDNIDNMTIEELDYAIKLALDISNNTMEQKFINQKNKEKNRIAEEERAEKKRIADDKRKEENERKEEERLQRLRPTIVGKYKFYAKDSGRSRDVWYIEFTADGEFNEYWNFMNIPTYKSGTYRITSVDKDNVKYITLYWNGSSTKYAVKGRIAMPLLDNGQVLGIQFEK